MQNLENRGDDVIHRLNLKCASESLKKASKMFDKPITTEVKELDNFYLAEGYHQDYYENNPNAPYCAFVIAPKIKKLGKKGLWDN